MTGSPSSLRIVKFLLIGGIGIGVQLGVLAVLTGIRVNYLLATFLAVEAAVLHNFAWHQGFTWSDRRTEKNAVSEITKRLWRFQISNGAISLLGNLLMMRLLVGFGKFPVVVANLVSITVCCLANFIASDRWVFALIPGESRAALSSD